MAFKFLKYVAVLAVLVGIIHLTPLPPNETYTRIGDHSIKTHLAYTGHEQLIGLSGRKTLLGLDEGMLFVARTPYNPCHWMDNTYIPLSIGFFDAQGRLIKATNMKILDKTYICADGLAMYVLEMRHNWFAENKIQLGQTLEGAQYTNLTFLQQLRLGFKARLGI